MAGYNLRAFSPLQLGNNCRFMWLCKSADRLNMWEQSNKAAVRPSRFYLQNLCYKGLQTHNLIAFLDCGKSGRGGEEHYCIYRDCLSILFMCVCVCMRVPVCLSVCVSSYFKNCYIFFRNSAKSQEQCKKWRESDVAGNLMIVVFKLSPCFNCNMLIFG